MTSTVVVVVTIAILHSLTPKLLLNGKSHLSLLALWILINAFIPFAHQSQLLYLRQYFAGELLIKLKIMFKLILSVSY